MGQSVAFLPGLSLSLSTSSIFFLLLSLFLILEARLGGSGGETTRPKEPAPSTKVSQLSPCIQVPAHDSTTEHWWLALVICPSAPQNRQLEENQTRQPNGEETRSRPPIPPKTSDRSAFYFVSPRNRGPHRFRSVPPPAPGGRPARRRAAAPRCGSPSWPSWTRSIRGADRVVGRGRWTSRGTSRRKSRR